MKDTKSSGAAKNAPAKTGTKAAAPKTAAKPEPKILAAKTVAKDKAKTPAVPRTGKSVTKDMAKPAKPAAKSQTAKTIDKAATMKAAVPELKKGDYIKFGSYYQESSSKKTSIEWLVLKKSDSKVFLISRYGLDCKKYHNDFMYITWENSDLRKWLNGEFFRNAFTAEEQKKIVVTKLANDNNAEYDTFGGNSTEDRVFLLSLAEAKSLFKADVARKCVPTLYAVGKGAWQNSSELIGGRGCCRWWLRSPGNFQLNASCVDTDGALAPHGNLVGRDNLAIRPAVWVDL